MKKDGNPYTGSAVTPSESGANKRFSFTLTEEGVYEIYVDAIRASSLAQKTFNLTIDKTAPVITVNGVVNGNTYTAHPVITFSSTATLTATVSKDGGAPLTVGSNYTTSANGAYALFLTSTDAAGNTATKTIGFTVNVATTTPGSGTPGSGTPGTGTPAPGGAPVIPPVMPPVADGAGTKETVTLTSGNRVLTFEDSNVVMHLNKTTVPAGTAFTVKRFELKEAQTILPAGVMAGTKPSMTSNGMTFKVASQLYDFTATKNFTGEIEITLPVDFTKVSKPSKLSIVWFDTATGKWTALGGKIDRKASTITFKTKHFSYYMVVEGQKTFSDIKNHGWAKDAIESLASRSIVSGVDLYNFSPGSEVTRAQFASMICSALMLSKQGSIGNFKDLGNAWYTAAMENAVSNKILQGSNGYLSPNASITREQMAVMIVNAYQMKAGSSAKAVDALTFADKDQMASWSVDAVALATQLKIVSGKGGNLFAPKAFANRAEAAMMIYKLLELVE